MGLLWGFVTSYLAADISRNGVAFGLMAGGGGHVQSLGLKAAGRSR